MRVGFIGLGDQGAPMADAIREAGHDLHLWARRPDVLRPFVEAGATAHATAAELAAEVDHLGICVLGEQDVRQVLVESGALSAMRRGAVVAVHSTISPQSCVAFASEAAARGVGFIDAPVSGGRARAITRTLLLMVGGGDEDVELARPVLESYASAIYHIGPVGSGEIAKIMNNLLSTCTLGAAAFTLELGELMGLAPAKLQDILMKGTANSAMLAAIGSWFVPGQMSIAVAEKDLRLARDLVESLGVGASPMANILELNHLGLQRLAGLSPSLADLAG